MEYTREIFLRQQTYATLFSVSNKLQVRGDKALELLTGRQLMTLIAIAHLPKGEASLNRIARKMGTTKQNVKQLIVVMEKKGYVNTIPSKTDKRAYSIEISEKGMTVGSECDRRGMAFLAEVFGGFSETELETFWAMLKKLYSFDGEAHDGFDVP